MIDAGSAPARIRDALKKAGATVIIGADPCVLPKARKNRIEQEGARAAQARDGVAVSRFCAGWRERHPRAGLPK